MKSYDIEIQNAIVKLLKKNDLPVVENQLVAKPDEPIIVISECMEEPDITKTEGRNILTYTVKMWSKRNGTSISLKRMKNKVIQALTDGDYFTPQKLYKVDDCIIDRLSIVNAYFFKEIDGKGGVSTTHYYQCAINLIFLVRGI